jgi:hypothetical protein
MACSFCRTVELSHAGPVTEDNSRHQGKPETLPDVGSSDLGNPQFITQKPPDLALCDRAGDRAKQLRPGQILPASLRLCVSALKSTPFKRKGAKTPRRKVSNRLALAAERF